MARLPIPGQDSGTWGDILNDYLSQVHNADGTLKTGSVGASQLQTNAVADATGAAKGVVQLAGDLTGTAASPQIAKIQGIALSGTPTAGQVLTASSGTAASWSTPSVASVAGKTGAVTLVESDITNLTTDLAAKYVKPVGGIPSTDMTAAVQASLAAADSASTQQARPSILRTKLRGGNIVVKPGYDWRYMWAEWDWDNWIKPQVDRAVALGLNAVRTIMAPVAIFNATVQWSAWASNTAYVVDNIRSNGGNAYRVVTAGTSSSSGPSGTGSSITDGTVVWEYIRPNNLTPLSQATYDAQFKQLTEYCASQGLFFYPCVCQQYDFLYVNGGYQHAGLTNSIVTTSQMLAAHNNVVGFDLFQEGDVHGATGTPWAQSTAYATGAYVNNNGLSYKATTGGISASSGSGPSGTGTGITDGTVVWDYYGVALLASDVLALAGKIRAVADVPLTMSANPDSFGLNWSQTNNLWYQALSGTNGLDFIDIHAYDTAITVQNLQTWASKLNKPIVIGEFGTGQDVSGSTQLTRYSTVAGMHLLDGVLGSFVWALADQGRLTSLQYGIWDNTGWAQGATNAPLSTTSGQRSSLVNAFYQFSTGQSMQPYMMTSQGILAPGGAIQFGFTTPANSVNYVSAVNQVAGASPGLKALGTDTDISFALIPKGAGGVLIYEAQSGQPATLSATSVDPNADLVLRPWGSGTVKVNSDQIATLTAAQTLTNKMLTSPKVDMILDTNGNTEVAYTASASAVNYIQLNNAATGGGPGISAKGSDTNISLTLQAKGTGGLTLYSGTSGTSPTISAQGVDANLDLKLNSLGTGTVKANGVQVVDIASAQTLTNKTLTSPKIGTSILDTNGNNELTFLAIASAVNYIQVNNAATGGGPALSAKGSDTNIPLTLQAKGTSGLILYSGTSGTSPTISAQGVDANLDLKLVSLGTGVVRANGNQVGTWSNTTISSSVTLSAVSGHRYITLLNTGAAPTLPTAVGNNSIYVLKNITGSSIGISTTSSQTIDGSGSYSLTAGSFIELVSDGSNWRSI